MALTKSFNETIKSKLQQSERFRRALLTEAVGAMIAGDVLRKYINGAIGFVKLGADLDRSPKVLMRMFSATGNGGSNAALHPPPPSSTARKRHE
jgi:hypothetical protein